MAQKHATQQRTTEQFAGPREFKEWMRVNHTTSPGIWLRIAKVGADLVTLTVQEAVEVALAYGWIDGQVRRCDDETFLQGYTRRRPRSPWSLRNRRKAEEMIAAGTMEPSGLEEVERARADGRWGRAYEGQRNAEMHPDLLEALETEPAAKAFYATLNSQNRYALYYRIQDAKRPETRRRRIERFVAMLARGETLH